MYKDIKFKRSKPKPWDMNVIILNKSNNYGLHGLCLLDRGSR
jgi:hypothetical protein